MLEPKNLIMLGIIVIINIGYLVLMSDRWNLKLYILLIYSLVITVGLAIFGAVKFFDVWLMVGLGIAVLYDLGIIIHLIRGNRTVCDVTGGGSCKCKHQHMHK